MADEDNEAEGKKKKPWLKMLLMLVVALLLLAATVGATLFFTGYFDDKDAATAEAQLQQAEQEAAKAQELAAAKMAEPDRVTKPTPQLTRFEYQYMELERELLANLTNSRKVMQVQLAFMTRYDNRVFENVKKHEFALRSAALDLMRQTTEADLANPEFRKNLAEKLRIEMNAVLERFEDFGGVEEVYFTNFVIQ